MPDPAIAAPVAPAAPAPAAAPEPSAPSPQPEGSQGIAQLRSAYDNLKKEIEPWSKLGVKPDQVSQFQGVYQKTFEEVAAIGRQLGYPDDEIVEALLENPIATLDYLRNEFAQAEAGREAPGEGDQRLQELIESRISEAVGPLQEAENVRLTREANALFERTVYQAAVDSFKQEGVDVANIPADEMFLLTSAASEILKYDDEALRALKYEGQTAPIQKAFLEAKTMLDKYYVARSGRDRGRPAGPARPGAPPAQAGGRKPTLDELIDSPELINKKYAGQ